MSKLSWVQAVKVWNSGQVFRDDMYGMPKKGGDYYDDVKEIMENSQHKKTVEKMMGKPSEINYFMGDHKHNINMAKKVLYGFSTDEEKRKAINILINITKIKDNNETIQERTRPFVREASMILDTIRKNPIQQVGLSVISPASGKPHIDAGNVRDFTPVATMIPEQSRVLVQEALELEKEKKKQRKKESEKSFKQSQIEIEERRKKQQLAYQSKESQNIRELYGKYPDKLFEILKEFSVSDAIDFERQRENIQRKYKSFPDNPTNAYGVTFWNEFDDFLKLYP